MNERKRAGKGLEGQSVVGFYDNLYFNTHKVPTAVAFQFSRIGSDPGALQLLIDLDRDSDLGEFIDVLPVEFNPSLDSDEDDKWWVVCHNLLPQAH